MRNCLANRIATFAFFAFDPGIRVYYHRRASVEIGEFFPSGRIVSGLIAGRFRGWRSDGNGTPRASVFALSGENGRLVCP
jgi:hypothetical protein